MLFLAAWFAPYDPMAQDREHAGNPPSSHHWLGTDDYGRDVFARFCHGGRWSILSGAVVTCIVLAIGWLVGGVAGYRGGWADQILMRVTEVFLVLPWLYLLIALRATLPLDLRPRTAMLLMLLLIAGISWPRPARLVRGLVMSLREQGYVEAAVGFGVPHWKVFLHHVAPGTFGLLATQALILLPGFVLADVAISFLGLGTAEPDPSWGALLIPLKHAWMLQQEWWRVLPALLMLPFFASFAWAANAYGRKLAR